MKLFSVVSVSVLLLLASLPALADNEGYCNKYDDPYNKFCEIGQSIEGSAGYCSQAASVSSRMDTAALNACLDGYEHPLKPRRRASAPERAVSGKKTTGKGDLPMSHEPSAPKTHSAH